MNVLRLFVRRLRGLVCKGKLEAEMTEEMRAHLELQTCENIARGMSAHEARCAARRSFGGVEQIQERGRDQRGLVWFEQLAQDLRYAVRQRAKSPGFTAVVVLTLALGIGATTAIYSVVDVVLLNPIPGPEPDRLVQIGQWITFSNRPTPEFAGVQPPVFEALEASRASYDEFTWCDSVQLERKGDDFATTVFGTMVPANFFAFLGARPVLGRTFAADEAVGFQSGIPAKDTVIVLSHAWWQSEFAGDRNVLGRAVEMGGRRFTVVGVMPAHFQFPGAGTVNQFWVPAEPKRPQPGTMSAGNTRFVVRLKAGVSLEQLQAMLDIIAQRVMKDHPATDRGYGGMWSRYPGGLRLWSRPFREAIPNRTYGGSYDALRRTLVGFLAAIGFVLAIVCANVANLTLARTERRQHELAIRAALGAGRGRLMRQLLTENIMLSCLGGSAGLIVTAWGMKLLVAFNTMPRLRPVEIDGGVLAIALLASLLTGVFFGLAPALQGGRTRINETLNQGGTGATAGGRASRYRSALVIVEVALAVVLLSGAGLMIESVVRLLRVDPGFDPTNLVAVRLSLITEARAGAEEKRNTVLAQLHERLAALPGVSAVGIFKDGFWEEKVTLQGRADPVLLFRAHCGWESSDYFRAARIPLAGGRYFERGDVGEKAGTVIVNETLAQLCWPGENAIGKKLRALDRRGEPTYEVVGVVRDARVYRLDESLRPIFYRPYSEAQLAGMAETLVLRTQQDPDSIIPAIRRELKAGNPGMRMPGISVFRQTLYDATRAQRTYRNYLAVFAGVGLLLAALGIYGVLAYSVARRTREIGIRIAIGADRRHVMNMVMGEGARLIGAGVMVGLGAAFWLTQLLQKQLFGVSPHDPAVLAGVIGALTAVALLACWLPARRAAKVDPMVALRTE